MELSERVARTRNLTPTEQQLAQAVLDLGRQVGNYTVKELAHATSSSPASVQRLCKKLGYTGFKELKIEAARETGIAPVLPTHVDVNFPFAPGDSNRTIITNMATLYATTITDTAKLLDLGELERAAQLIDQAEHVTIFTGSHNIYPAQMFEDRLLSAGKRAACPESGERQTRLAMRAGARDAAILITYSGLPPAYPRTVRLLKEREAPIILVGSRRARQRLAGLDAYLMVSARESLQNRITQFASHISVQFVLDALFCSVFARDYKRSMEFLQLSLPYTALLNGAGPGGR